MKILATLAVTQRSCCIGSMGELKRTARRSHARTRQMNVHCADTRVTGRGEEGALLLDTLAEVEQSLHVEIRAQKREREAGGLDDS